MSKTIRITNGLGAVKDIVPNRLKEHEALGWEKVEAKVKDEKETDAKQEDKGIDEKKVLKQKALDLGIEVLPQWGIPKLTEAIKEKEAEATKE